MNELIKLKHYSDVDCDRIQQTKIVRSKINFITHYEDTNHSMCMVNKVHWLEINFEDGFNSFLVTQNELDLFLKEFDNE